MSISSMADLAYARRRDVAPLNTGLETLDTIASEKGQKEATASGPTSALAAIAAYIPTEIVTVYVAVLAAVGVAVPTEASPAVAASVPPAAATPLEVYVLFLTLTPIATWALYAAKVVTAGKPLPRGWAAWPKWEMLAAAVSFAVWAAALPSSPFERFEWFTAAVAGLGALIISMLLGLFAPLFSRAALAET